MKHPFTSHRFVPSLIIVALIVPSFLIIPRKTGAIAGIDLGSLSGIATGLGSAALGSVGGSLGAVLGGAGVPVFDPATAQRQFDKTVLDKIAWMAAKQIIRSMTTSIVNWINTGFEGEPAFITDPGAYFTDIADQVSGLYIKGLGLENKLCGPFSSQIRLGLLSRRRDGGMERMQCTLSSVVKDMQGFLNDFEKGGWPAWLSLIQEENNPYMRFLEEDDRINALVTSEVSIKEKEADWGRGFLSLKNKKGKTATPGAIIEQELVQVLGSDVRQLELADEFNEIISALIGQLLTQAITGIQGLRGTSEPSYGEQESILDQIRIEVNPAELSARGDLIIGIEQNISLERTYISVKNDSLRFLAETRQDLLELIACLEKKPTTFTFDDGTTGVREIQNASTTIREKILSRLPTLDRDILVSNRFIEGFQILIDQTAKAANLQELSEIANNYKVFELATHNQIDLGTAQEEFGNISNEMANISSESNQKLNQCRRVI